MEQTHVSIRTRAAWVSLLCNVGLTVAKLIGAVLTGSVSLLSDAVHSATDIVSSAIAFISVRVAMAPPDEEHPYGHGKVESLAGFAESIMLLGIVGYLGFESIHRLFSPSKVENVWLGVAVMSISAAASLIAGKYVERAAKRTDSMSLRSNGQHFMVDFWTSLGVALALLITKFSGWQRADSVLGLILASWLAHGAWKMAAVAFHELIDHRIEDAEDEKIRSILNSDPDLISYHRLRTRHSGSWHHVDVHVVVPREWSVVQAHDIADRLEKQIASALSPAQVFIHVDPYDEAKAALGTS